jgi:hypothetical protein
MIAKIPEMLSDVIQQIRVYHQFMYNAIPFMKILGIFNIILYEKVNPTNFTDSGIYFSKLGETGIFNGLQFLHQYPIQ